MNNVERGDGVRCLICKNLAEAGALSFCNEMICADCEAALMACSAEQPIYDHIIHVLRLLWEREFSGQFSRPFPEGAD